MRNPPGWWPGLLCESWKTHHYQQKAIPAVRLGVWDGIGGMAMHILHDLGLAELDSTNIPIINRLQIDSTFSWPKSLYLDTYLSLTYLVQQS
jgi:hypothetical protein